MVVYNQTMLNGARMPRATLGDLDIHLYSSPFKKTRADSFEMNFDEHTFDWTEADEDWMDEIGEYDGTEDDLIAATLLTQGTFDITKYQYT